MIGKKYKVILTMGLVFLLINISLVSCTSKLLKASKTSGIDEEGNEELLGKVTCIDESSLTLAVGNELDSNIINEDSVDTLSEEKDNKCIGEGRLLFEPSGEEKIIEVTNASVIYIEDNDITLGGHLSDINIGCILSVQYDDSNNLTSVLIKDSNKYLNQFDD